MKLLRYGIAFVLTIVLLGIAKKTSTRHPTEYTERIGEITVSHTTVTEDFGEGPVLDMTASSTEGLTSIAYFASSEGSSYQADTLTLTESGFTGKLPVLPKGKRWYYHIDIIKDGQVVAKLPPNGDQFIKFKGHVPAYVLVPHIFCMFATVFFGLLTVFSAFDFKRGKGELSRSVRYLLWTVIFVFVGGFPLGYWVAYLAFGQGWGGIPIGWDITDNKTVIIFLFWFVTLILARKGLKGGRMAVSSGTYLALTIISMIVSLVLFMVPHSI